MIYEILRHRVRPPAEPVCEGCQRDLPVAEDGEWLTYRRTGRKWARETQDDEMRESYMQLAQVWLKAASLVDGRPPTPTAPPDMPTKAA